MLFVNNDKINVVYKELTQPGVVNLINRINIPVHYNVDDAITFNKHG